MTLDELIEQLNSPTVLNPDVVEAVKDALRACWAGDERDAVMKGEKE